MKKMKHALLAAAVAAVCFPAGAVAPNAGANRPGARQEKTFRFMPEAKAPKVFGAKGNAAAGARMMAAAVAESKKSLPEGDTMGFLETPDGEPWVYVAQFTKGDNGGISHFAFTVYDADFAEVTTIEGDTQLAENETRIVDVQLGSLITKKFYNSDDKPEFMVMFAANTAEYVNHYYTKVYSAGVDEPVAEIEGYYCVAVNTSTDSWSEKYYIGFVTEQEAEQAEIGGVMNSMDYVIDIYKQAAFSTPSEVVHQIRIPGLLATGENWIPVVATAHDGTACFAANYLKYSFYKDPLDYTSEELTADNEFIIDYYEVPRYGEVKLTYRNTIPAAGSASDMNFYYLGAFMFDSDITYGVYNDKDEPAFIVSRAHYESQSDDYSWSYDVYPAGTEEKPVTEKLLTIGEGIDGVTFMSDVRGYDPQVMFVKKNGEDYTFEFVNLLTGKVESTLPYVIADNVFMNAGVDRVAGGDGLLYVVSQSTAQADAEGNAIHVMAYVTPEGLLHHTDRLNLGQMVAYASAFNSAYALDPYIFNTDPDREYMVLVKRYLNESGSKTREELMVVSPSKGALLTLLPDEKLGAIAYVELDGKSDQYGQNLCVVYQTPEFRYNTVRYELPLEKFAGGDGTEANPWQIATLGDLRQVKFSPAAHYVLADDLDARGTEMEHVTGAFTGTFDGCGHNIIGPELYGMGIFERLSGESAVVKNLNIIAPKVVVSGNYDAVGILANEVMNAKISDVRVYDAKVEAETADVSSKFGGIAGNTSLFAEITGSAVIGADINLPESSVGGIAGQIATSTTIKACSFKGTITGGETVGGIVGATIAAADCIEDCHVNAAITGKNTIGGVAGSSERGKMERCHVQGTIEATEAPMWGGGASTGGLIGELAADWDMSSDSEVTPTIRGNFINLTSMKAFEPEDEPEFDGQYDTFHRVVGKTCVNDGGEPIYDDEWNVIGFEDAMVEKILGENYVGGALARINEAIEDDAATTEGKSVSDEELGKEFFEGLGYQFGDENATPWSEMSPKAPFLYFESGMILFDKASYTVDVDAEADIIINLFGEELTEEAAGAFIVDIADESVLEFVNLTIDDGALLLTVKGLKGGATSIIASYNGQTARTGVTVEERSGIDAVEAGSALPVDVNGTVVTAAGCEIAVYSMTGAKVLGGLNVCDLGSLAHGVYVVTATDKSGNRTSLKVVR